MNNSDLYLGYRGGSGGFILLHLLLCSDEFAISFDDGYTIDDAITAQWQISDPSNWKKTEKWPNQWNTIWSSSFLPKIYFFCNPSLTDFFNQEQKYLIDSYTKIKDISWPEIDGYQSYTRLPTHIKKECEIQHGLAPLLKYYSNPKKFVWIYTDIQSQNDLSFYKKAYWYFPDPLMFKKTLELSASYKEHYIDEKALPFLNKCDVVLRLQDVINDPKILVDKGLISSIGKKQIDLINRWISLHPAELLDKIGITPL